MTPAKPPLLDSAFTAAIIKGMSRANVKLFQLTGGRFGATWRVGSAFRHGLPICLLTTTGRRSGEPRTVPLLFLPDGDRVILVASQGGLPRHPLWYLNIQAYPEVVVQIGRRKRPLRARAATEAERTALWPRLVEMYADFDSYQSWTDRTIPVVICEPAG